jgi:nitrite reductase/ring-hydroxylating ferredoxin subunit
VACLDENPAGAAPTLEEYPMDDPEKSPCSACISRRAVLRAGAGVGAAGALLAALPLGCMQGSSGPSGPVAAGNVSDTQVGMLKLVTGESLILARDLRGLYAMTQVCTHAGAPVTIISTGAIPMLHCYGHGSEFTMDGMVTHGPATQPLEHFQVDVAADGSITIRGDIPVAADVRTSPEPS